VRQVIVDLPPHAINLLIDFRSKLLMSCRSRLLRLVRQHRKGRLQTMREIAGFRDGARDTPLALVEQRVQVIDQRLDLRRIAGEQQEPGDLALMNHRLVGWRDETQTSFKRLILRAVLHKV
jgi:hypothetical protein